MEEYGIELKLILDKFNQKIEEVKNKFKGIEEVQVDAGKQFKIDTLTKKMQIAQQQLDALQAKYKKLAQEEETYYQQQLKYASMVSGGGVPVEQLLEGDTTYQKMIENLDKLKLQIDGAKLKTGEYREKIRQLQEQFNKLKDNTEKTEKSFNGMWSGIDKITSKIKRFALALFSVRSIYALVSRASSAYLAQDTELSNKLQAVWAGLGSLLAPIIEKIVNVLLKGVKYINIFVKALTGVDLLAKATTKSLNSATKSAKALSKTLAGFDELTNLDTTSDVGGSSSTNPFSAFDDVDIDTTWADRIESFGNWLREHWVEVVTGIAGIVGALKLLNEVGVTSKTALAIGSLALEIGGAYLEYNGIKKVLNGDLSANTFLELLAGSIGIGAGAGLGVYTFTGDVSLALKVGLIVTAFTSAFNFGTAIGEWINQNYGDSYTWYIKEFKLDWSDGYKFGNITKTVGVMLGTIGDAILKGINNFSMKISSKISKKVAELFFGESQSEEVYKNLLKSVTKAWKDFFAGKFTGNQELLTKAKSYLYSVAVASFEGFEEGLNKKISGFGDWARKKFLDPLLAALKIIWGIHSPSTVMRDEIGQYLGQGLLEGVSNGIKNNTFIKKVTSAWNSIKSIFSNPTASVSVKFPTANSIVNTWNNLKKKITGFSVNITLKMTSIVSDLKKWLNTNLIDKINKALPSFIGKIPQLAVGTNYIPEDQLAMVHKGEAIVPKKFNSDEYFGRGNDETNSLLVDLIEAVNNIEINPYTTIKDVGERAVSYINSKNRQLGRSVIA